MRRTRNLSVILLSVSALIGLIRGIRMITYNEQQSIPYLYPKETIKISVFSNYYILGWIVFSLIGIFSIIAIIATLRNIRNYAYFIIVEGIFLSFLTISHIIVTEFSFVHLLVLPICIGNVVLGIIQTPKEF